MAEFEVFAEDADITEDAFFGGRVRLFQPRVGFRAGTDSVLLATALPADLEGEGLELGCGAGGALLPAAYRLKKAAFTGLEREAGLCRLARMGAAANQFETRLEIVEADAATLPQDWHNRFDLVFSNPPFFRPGETQPPGPGKAAAYLESLSLRAWLQAMLFALRPKGSLILVHRASELARILMVLERQCGQIAVRPVHSYPGSEAKRILIRARKGLRPGPLRLLEPLYLYTEKGGPRTGWAVAMQQEGVGQIWA